jgi:glycosyltransferase involved in cell wall biosynthesis
MEGLACGLPCFVTPAANPCGLIGKYHAGIEVALDVDAIADGFKQLASMSHDARCSMKKEAVRMVGQEFQWRDIARTLVDGYSIHLASAPAR